jgi:hypothetical protein
MNGLNRDFQNEESEMTTIELLQMARRTHSFQKLIASAACALATFTFQFTPSLTLQAAENEAGAASDAPVIRPANYDPADELAYTRQRGELSAGAVANGQVWNKPFEDSRAAVSGVTPAPADAAAPGAPVPAASGASAPRMTYAEAYAQIPFSRSEYEANPSYRHDAALELMMGTMRPTYINRQTTPYFSRYPDMFRYRFPVFPYQSSTGGATELNMNWRTSLIAY